MSDQDPAAAINNLGRAAGLAVVPEDGAPIVLVHADLNQTALRLGEVVGRLDLFELNGKLLYFDQDGERQEMDEYVFRTWINEHILVAAKYDKDGRAIPTTLTVTDARTVLASLSFRRCVRTVEAINRVRLPIMRERDGEKVIELLPWGFDEESRIYTVPGGLDYDLEMDLAVARGWVERYFGTFPFHDDRSMAVQVAALVSLYCKHLLPAGCLRKGFLWRANKPDSGKSVAAKAALYPVLGHAAAAKLKSKEDLDKEMEAFLRAAVPYIFLDNVYGGLRSATIDQLMTSKESTFRGMGGHGVVRVRNQALLLVTGNNMEANEDAARRFLLVDLFEEGNPQDRVISAPLDDELMGSDEWRGQALAVLWAMVRAWDDAGRPAGQTVDRTFADYTKLLGGIVMAAGYADPIAVPSTEEALNPDQADFQALLVSLVEEMQEEDEGERLWSLEAMAKVARARDLFGDKVGTAEQGKKLTIKEEGLKGDERVHAMDEGYLTPSQRQKWNDFLKGEVGRKPTVGDVRVQFGTRRERRKTAYTITLLD